MRKRLCDNNFTTDDAMQFSWQTIQSSDYKNTW